VRPTPAALLIGSYMQNQQPGGPLPQESDSASKQAKGLGHGSVCGSAAGVRLQEAWRAEPFGGKGKEGTTVSSQTTRYAYVSM
jgi:hypothetical protein